MDDNIAPKDMKKVHRELFFAVSNSTKTMKSTVKSLGIRFITNKRNDFFFPHRMSN